MARVAPTTAAERDEVRVSSRAGFAFLFVNGVAWVVTGASTFVLPLQTAALVMIWSGAVSTPLSFALQRVLKYPQLSKANSLLPLLIQTASVLLLALPAVILIYTQQPAYVPAAFAAVVGGHLFPYVWIHKSQLYGVLAVVVAIVPFLMTMVLKDAAFHYVNFVVGAAVLLCALALRAQVEAELGERREADLAATRAPGR